MKKTSPKLSLNRETLRTLEEARLQAHQVQGAGTLACDDSLNYSCDPASVRICPASRRVC